MIATKQRKLKPLTVFTAIILGLGLPCAVYFAKHSQLTIVKIVFFVIAAVSFILLEIMKQRGFIKLGELEKTIQLQIYARSFSAFITFLFVFMALQASFRFNLDAEDAIIIILLVTSIIQLVATIIIKKKYS